jgi:hypothetical protein
MGKVTHQGWSKPGDEIPMPVGIVMGANVRKQPARPAPLSEAERVLQSIAEYCETQKKLESQ